MLHIVDLRTYIKRSGLSRATFGRLIGVDERSVGRYIRRVRLPEREVVLRIASVTGGLVTADDLYGIRKRQQP